MKILYVVSRPLEINSSSSLSNKAIIEGLLENDHVVNLITTQYDENHINFDKGIINKNLKVKYLEIGGVHKIAKHSRRLSLLKPIKKVIYQIMSKFQIYDNLKGISRFALKEELRDQEYDLIISSSDPKSSHLFISKIFENGKLEKTPWIQIWGDPFLLDITRKNKLLNPKIKLEESRLLKYATKIIYVSSLTLQEQRKLYPQYANKMSYEPIPYLEKKEYSLEETQKTSITFLYSGDYSSNIRDIKPLYNVIKNSKHKLIICGKSDLDLQDTERIKVYPRVSYEKTKELESDCDVLVHLSNNKGTQIPGKIYQFSGTNKLILFILDGDKRPIIEEFSKYNRYVFCENNEEDIKRSILEFQQGKHNEKRFIVEEFSPQFVTENIINLKNYY